jgi:hypothetical protein
MIKNERQHRITKMQAEKFAQALAQSEQSPESDQTLRQTGIVHPLLQQAQADALHSQLESLQEEINAYETIRPG